MHIVLDFDGTLYNTEQLWKDWLDRLTDQGIDRDEAVEIGEQLFSVGFTLREHAEQAGIAGDELDQLVSDFELYTEEESERLLFDDVKAFIDSHKKKCTFSILTFGDPDYQNFKISATGLDDIIDVIHIARPERKKHLHLKEILAEHEEVMFIDDSPRELEAVQDADLPIKLIRMIRPDSRHTIESHADDGVAWQTVSKLAEIEM